MRRQSLGQTKIEVSRLGFGCVKLTTHRRQQDAIRILEHAFEQGITHFDVARAYGFGRAESILGEFLAGKRARVTVTTKFGIEPPAGLAGKRWLVGVAKQILRPFPWLLRRTQRLGGGMVRSHVFSPEAAIRSLETSLRELKTEYVDFLLLHEATVAEAANAPLIEALQKQIDRGTVRAVGIGSEFSKLGAKEALDPAYQVIQFENNVTARNAAALAQSAGRGLITHSIFKPVTFLMPAIQSRSEVVRQYSSQLQTDLADPSIIAGFLLQYALRNNPDGVVLFSSNQPARISRNVQQAEGGAYTAEQISQFLHFVDEILAAHPAGSSREPAVASIPDGPA